jgi:hypothetical protein
MVEGVARGDVKDFGLTAKAIEGLDGTNPTSISNIRAAAAMASFIITFDVVAAPPAGYKRQLRRSVTFLYLKPLWLGRAFEARGWTTRAAYTPLRA